MTKYYGIFGVLMSAVLLSASEFFEAEAVLKPGIEYTVDQMDDTQWDLWSKDVHAASWSGGKTLRQRKAMTADCPPDKAPGGILEFEIPVKKDGVYSLRASVGTFRSFGFSVDGGKTWKKFNQPKPVIFQGRSCKAGEKIRVLAANCFGTTPKAGTVYLDTFELFETPKDKKVNTAKVFKSVPTPESAGMGGRFEAEDVLVPGTELHFNVPGAKWDLWDRDVNISAWSGRRTLRAGKIAADVAPDKAPSGILTFRIPVRKDGIYRLRVHTGRNVGFSVDGGKTWQNSGKNNVLFGNRRLKAGDTVEVLCANCFVTAENPGSAYFDYFELMELAPPKLLNPDYSGKIDPKTGTPEGWFLFCYATNGSKIAVGKGKVTIEATATIIFTNKALLPGEVGDIFEVAIPIKNLGKFAQRPFAQFVGMAGGRIVNHNVNMTVCPLKPQESGIIKLTCTMPLNGGFSDMQYRIVGEKGKLEIGAPQFRFLGNARVLGNKVNFAFSKDDKLVWTAQNASLKLRPDGKLEVTGKPGVRWSVSSSDFRYIVSGSGVHFAAKAESAGGKEAKVRMRIPALASGVQSRMAVNECAWRKIGSKAFEFRYDFSIPRIDCDKLGVAFDGEGSVVLSPVEVAEIPPPEPVRPVYCKVPMSGAPVPALKLGRGLVVIRREDGSHYASWRLTAQDDPKIAFDIFSIVDGKETKLNGKPIVQTTDFVIKSPVSGAKYAVRPTPPFKGASGTAAVETEKSHLYMLSDPRCYVYGIAPADLDGDGEIDYVAHGCTTNVDPILYHKVANPAPVRVEAFHRDGRRLWSKSLGPNIEMGMWFCPVTAADLDGDGKAEVIVKGSSEEDGSFLEPDGPNWNKVMSGPEYLIVLDGMTGRELARAPWPSRHEYFMRGEAHNFFARNQMAIFRPDGKTNCVLALRGTYTHMQCDAWKYANGKLERVWSFNNSYLPAEWQGQGSHNTRVADVDGDGRDEVLLGASVIDDDGSPMWTTGGGHPDYLFVCDITKKNPGLEVITIYEAHRLKHGGFTCANAKDGKVVWELKKPHRHVHRGYCGDMDARYRGWETGGADSINGGHDGPLLEYHWSPEGELLGYNETAPYRNYKPFIPHFAYWDGDLQREEIGRQMKDFRGGPCGGGVNGTFIAQFDVEGDWREEIAVRARGGFRICFTPVPAMDRRVSLMYDDVYRHSVLANSSGYLFDPSLGYLPTDDAPNLNLTMLKDVPGTLEVTVSAPYKKAVAGKLTLFPPAGVKLAQTEFDFALKEAEIKTVQIKGDGISKESGLVTAEWHLNDGRILHGQVPTALEKTKKVPTFKPVKGSIVLEGENFNIQRGGTVVIRSDKKGVHGKCFSHWDLPGHLIGWKFNCDQPGKYRLTLRHACANYSIRRFICNGETLGEADIIGTGGGGDTPGEWAFSTPEIDGKPVVVTLKKGENTLEMVNVRNSLNIDYVMLVPVK